MVVTSHVLEILAITTKLCIEYARVEALMTVSLILDLIHRQTVYSQAIHSHHRATFSIHMIRNPSFRLPCKCLQWIKDNSILEAQHWSDTGKTFHVPNRCERARLLPDNKLPWQGNFILGPSWVQNLRLQAINVNPCHLRIVDSLCNVEAQIQLVMICLRSRQDKRSSLLYKHVGVNRGAKAVFKTVYWWLNDPQQ